ncbi:diguanylate phosphodiesterase [Variovorax sp. KBW07]|uniref:EAL domain-containing protein n=1 Tax=Variovorax sp. KBW07 TaxID=2153358 RepID=UPI000F574C3A|nr:phosphodiesterase [Variovorax sp. KBW07]RQO62319.1 diguanylate phosphodiesterase [Variovorax sp. KBW07]
MPRHIRPSDTPASHPTVYPVFQPIVDLRQGTIFGHEALIRGPVGTPLHCPLALLAQAASESRLTEFELHCVEVIFTHWGQLPKPGRLFVNMSADALVAAMGGVGTACWLERMLAHCDISARDVTVELTEQRAAVNPEALRQAVKALHALGALVALDDFGEGHSNLRRWKDLQPDFVKIDKLLTQGIASSPQSVALVRAIVGLGNALGTELVAEGVEDAKDLRVLRDLGIAHGQGYLFGRPAPALQSSLPEPVTATIHDARIAVMPHASQPSQPNVLRGLSVIQAPALSPQTPIDEVSAIFQKHPDLHALAVVEQGRPVALINRQSFMNDYARMYFREVHGRRPCLLYGSLSPRIVEREENVESLLGILMSEDQRYLSEGFIVTEKKRYAGLGTGDQLVRAVTEARIEAARHANPLTFLPGNIPINIHIARLLEGRADFVACYADLNNFKVFNDHYGYWRGDEMILLLARLATQHANPHRDFVGHIGGDDFLVLYQSPDWRQRCTRLIDEFNRQAPGLYDEADRLAGGVEGEDRQGVLRFTPCATLSIGAVRIPPDMFRHAEDVASEAAIAKHEAKHTASGLTVREPRPRT